jgi:hypothetical protein
MKRSFLKSRRRKGQSLIEFAFGALLLVLLLAAAVDFGRAFYTYTVVLNMAGEGAAVLAVNPDADMDEGPVGYTVDDTYQMRARAVAARVMGAVIDPSNVDIARGDVQVTDLDGNPMPPTARCVNTAFAVHVRYRITDLFFPALLGMSELDIGAAAPSSFSIQSSYGHCT